MSAYEVTQKAHNALLSWLINRQGQRIPEWGSDISCRGQCIRQGHTPEPLRESTWELFLNTDPTLFQEETEEKRK